MPTDTNKKSGPVRFINDYFETMHALPDNQRRIFAAVTFVIGIISVGLASWLLFPPLQDLNAPTLQDNNEAQAFARPDTGAIPIADGSQRASIGADGSGNSLFAGANNIPQISPVKGFIDSFNAVKDLLMPADTHAIAQSSVWQTATGELSQWARQIASKAGAFLQYAFDQTKIFLNFLRQALHYISDALNKFISSTSPVSQ